MNALFFETRSFTASLGQYLNDEQYRQLQLLLLAKPLCGDVIPGTGGFRKLRWGDIRRKKGKRGGLRVIYYWLPVPGQFWMFAVYDKDEVIDLTRHEAAMLKRAITSELKLRRHL